MNKTKTLLAVAVSMGLALPVMADNHSSEVEQKIAIHHVHVKVGHGPAFQAGMAAFSECLADNDYDEGYSVWQNVDGDRTGYHIVSGFEKWAEFDGEDDASDACWGDDDIREGVFDHMASWHTSYAKVLPEWSRMVEGSQVVKLHNFNVSNGEAFRGLVGEITGMMAKADYPNQGTWYEMVEGRMNADADYFVVEHFESYAAMDEDRAGASGFLEDAIGEEKANEFWSKFGDSLEDEGGYWTQVLSRQASMGYSADD